MQGPAGPTAQVLSRGAGFVSSQPPELVFGLGDRDAARVEVLWPGGARESFGELAAGTRALLVEGTGTAEPLAALPRPLPDPLPPGLRLDEGDAVPRIAVLDRDGEPTVLDAAVLANGKPLLLNLWASYCAPCVAELPLLQRMHAEGEVRIVALCVDVPGDVPEARRILDRTGVGFPCFFVSAGPDARSASGGAPADALIDLERLTIPTTLALSPEGRLESILRGPLEPPDAGDGR